MEFLKYPSIENSYRTSFIERFLFQHFELKDELFVVCEKLHGTNISLVFEPDSSFKIASRNQFSDESFFDIGKYFERDITLLIIGQNLADATNQEIRFFGEFFGPGIMKGVDYGKEKQLRLFDIFLQTVGFLPYKEFKTFCESIRISEKYRVPEIETIAFEQIFNYNPRFNSKILEIENNICEGVVVRPLRNEYRNKVGDRFILKIKNEEFKEKSKQPKVPVQMDDDVVRLNLEFRSYITSSRLDGIFSKFGKIEETSEISKYMRLLIEDAKEDFRKDFPEIDEVDPKKHKAIYNIGSSGFELLKKHLN